MQHKGTIWPASTLEHGIRRPLATQCAVIVLDRTSTNRYGDVPFRRIADRHVDCAIPINRFVTNERHANLFTGLTWSERHCAGVRRVVWTLRRELDCTFTTTSRQSRASQPSPCFVITVCCNDVGDFDRVAVNAVVELNAELVRHCVCRSLEDVVVRDHNQTTAVLHILPEVGTGGLRQLVCTSRVRRHQDDAIVLLKGSRVVSVPTCGQSRFWNATGSSDRRWNPDTETIRLVVDGVLRTSSSVTDKQHLLPACNSAHRPLNQVLQVSERWRKTDTAGEEVCERGVCLRLRTQPVERLWQEVLKPTASSKINGECQ
ncbi:hypothetical protein D3C71_1137840 [compost metagenome]